MNTSEFNAKALGDGKTLNYQLRGEEKGLGVNSREGGSGWRQLRSHGGSSILHQTATWIC